MMRPSGSSTSSTASTSTATVLTLLNDAAVTEGLCCDAEGCLYFTLRSHKCVYKVVRQHGTYSRAFVLSGNRYDGDEAYDADFGDAVRFRRPCGVCLNPLLDGRSLLVMDDDRMRSVDTLSGAACTMPIHGYLTDGLGRCTAGTHDVWMMAPTDQVPDEQMNHVLRLDLRSLEVQVVLPHTSLDTVLCVNSEGHAVCAAWYTYIDLEPQLWRVTPDGSATLLAGAVEEGLLDGPAEQARFGMRLYAAAAGDGSVVVADKHNCCLRLLAPDGNVSTLAGCGQRAVRDGPPAQASFRSLRDVVVVPSGDVLVVDFEERAMDGTWWDMRLRTVPARLSPPPHLTPAPEPPHPLVTMNGSLLQSGLLADVTIRVVERRQRQQQRGSRQQGEPPEKQQHQKHQQEAWRSTAGAAEMASRSGAGGGRPAGYRPAATAAAEPDSAAAVTVDIPCHRNILAIASPFFRALFVGPMAWQSAAASGVLGRKRRAGDSAGGEASTAASDPGDGGGAGGGPGTTPAMVVMVDDASADAVRAVLRHVYTGDLGSVTAATAQDVLHLAQLWGLDRLLEACQAYVVEQLLGPGDAVEWLLVADGRNYGTIRAAALRAVVEHFKSVKTDSAQLSLLKRYPDLMVEAMGLMAGNEQSSY